MKSKFTRRIMLPILVYCFFDLLAHGIGIGVPIFAIPMGIIVGWIAPSILYSYGHSLRQALRTCLVLACWTAAFSFLVLITIWGPAMTMLADPKADFMNFGIPMILFDPKASFIGGSS